MQIIDLIRMASGCVGQAVIIVNARMMAVSDQDREQIIDNCQVMISRLEYVICTLNGEGDVN